MSCLIHSIWMKPEKWLQRFFCSHKLEVIRDAEAMHLQHNSVSGMRFSINYIHYGATVLIEPGELENFYLLQIPLKGCAQITNGKYSCRSSPMVGTILNPDRFTSMIWHAGCRQILVYISVDVFRPFIENFLGRTLEKPIVFETRIDFSRPGLAKWRQHIIALVAATDAEDLFQENNALNQLMLEQEILAEFITFQPSNIQQFINRQSSDPKAVYVKKSPAIYNRKCG